MNAVTRPVHLQRPATHLALTLGSLTLLGSVTALVLFALLGSPLKDDIAWLLYVSRRWLGGRELYVDLVEVNPPLIVWISAIPMQLSAWLGAEPQHIAIPFFVAAVLAPCGWAARLLKPFGGLFINPVPVFAVLGSAILIIPAGDLGQREHLLIAAALPYLVLSARTLTGAEPGRLEAIVAGLLAGLGCALKPRYAVAYAAVECLVIMSGPRPWRLRPLAASFVLTLLFYALAAAVTCPAYLRRAVPLALALYGATDVSFRHLFADSTVMLAAQAGGFVLWSRLGRRTHESRLILSLLVFASAAAAICFLDGKDWYYHRLPAIVATFLALLLAACVIWRQGLRGEGRRIAPFLLAVTAGAILAAGALRQFEPQVALAVEPERSTVVRLEKLIRQEHAHTYIAFSEWIALGFPVVNNTGVVWTSRFDSMWALKGELWRAHFDPATDREWPIRRWVAHDFISGCPDLAVVDRRGPFNYPDILAAADPAFARAWSRYRPIAAFDGLIIYRRSAAGCADPWVAAGDAPPSTTP